MDAAQDVKLYVYDLSKGLARSLSPMFLGQCDISTTVTDYLFSFIGCQLVLNIFVRKCEDFWLFYNTAQRTDTMRTSVCCCLATNTAEQSYPLVFSVTHLVLKCLVMAAVSRSLCCNTGRQIDGVWHTGIVVYGEEFFYGGAGIHSCSPVSEICVCFVSRSGHIQ